MAYSEKSEKEESESKSKPDLTEAQWWRAKDHGRAPHQILDNLFKQIEEDQEGRYDAYKEYERLFGNACGPNSDDSFQSIATDEVTQNELQNTVETLWSQVFRNKVVPAVSVTEADWDEWDKARSYSRWLEGVFDEADVYEECFPHAGACTLVHGTGVIRVGWEETEDEGVARIKFWSVNPRFVFVDRMESVHGKPRSIYFKDHVDKYKLFDIYKDDEDGFYGTSEERRTGINRAPVNDDIDLSTRNTTRCSMVTVKEAYHLPSSPESEDGRHVIWVNGCTLVDEPYAWDTFPCAFMRFGARLSGFWGESAVRRLAPLQKLLDKLCSKINESQDVMGVPRILVGNSAGLKRGHLDDIPGGVLQVNDINQVKDWNAQCVTPELYQERDSLPAKMRALLGISDFEASSTLPQGLRDVGAPFMEHMVEQGAARHAKLHDQYEDCVVQLAYLSMLQGECLEEMGYDVVVRGPAETMKTSIQQLSFKDVKVARKQMKLRVQPMSQLPQTFAGKVDAISKLKNDAMMPVDPKTAARMMEVPDLFGATDMLVSDEEIIMKNLTHMCKTGKYLAPLPFDNLDLIVQLTTRYINRYRTKQDVDYARVGLLAQYIDDAIALKNAKLGGTDPNAPPSVSTMGALGMQPPGMPPQGMGAPMGPMAGPPPGTVGGPVLGAPMGPAPPMAGPPQF